MAWIEFENYRELRTRPERADLRLGAHGFLERLACVQAGIREAAELAAQEAAELEAQRLASISIQRSEAGRRGG